MRFLSKYINETLVKLFIVLIIFFCAFAVFETFNKNILKNDFNKYNKEYINCCNNKDKTYFFNSQLNVDLKRDDISNALLDINVGVEKLNEQENEIETKDDTIFNLYYEEKMWSFKASDFELNSNIFSLDSRINNYNRNGNRKDKIELLNKLIDINIEPEIAFSYIYFKFDKKINKIAKNIEKTPKNAEIKINNNNLKIFNEIIGIKLNKTLFYNNLIELYKDNNKIINLEIPVVKQAPNITKKDLEKEVYKRSEFSTSISSSSTSRKHNIKKALTMINGKKLVKGEKFSFNKCVGRRTVENGFKQAKIILDGEFVEGIGGGVCQVSSTLYNSALLAGLNVLSSQKHSQKVGYVKSGFDAMVNYGTSDLVFENNTEGNIYILCKYTPDKITISIYGYNLNGISYSTDNEITDTIKPKESRIIYDNEGKYLDKVQYSDESFVLKKSKEGYTVKSYRLKYNNGELVERQLLRVDKYPAQQGEIVYGVKTRIEDQIIDMQQFVV